MSAKMSDWNKKQNCHRSFGGTKALPIAFVPLVKPGAFELRFDGNHARIVLNLKEWLCIHRA